MSKTCKLKTLRRFRKRGQPDKRFEKQSIRMVAIKDGRWLYQNKK